MPADGRWEFNLAFKGLNCRPTLVIFDVDTRIYFEQYEVWTLINMGGEGVHVTTES
jgi:hypothetical protein